MTGRRAVLVGAVLVAAAVALAVFLRESERAPAGCDTVRALIADNSEFAARMKDAAAADRGSADGAASVTIDQYREWSARVRDYAERISEPQLSGRAGTAADLAGRIADLVPRYRANPGDAAVAREYAGLGIEYGNAINRLEYACLYPG